MTSQVSLTVNKQGRAFHPAQHAFCHALGDGLAVAVVTAVLLSGIVGWAFSRAADNARMAGLTLSGVYQYFILDQFAGFYWPALLMLAAVVQALIAFRFLFHKTAANAWYSLGLTRSELFVTRFLAGAAGALLPVLLAMLVALTLSLASFSNAGLVLSRWLALTAGLLTQALALYGIAALACVLVGTMVEGLVHSVVLIGLPTAILAGVNALTLRFLFGNGIGAPEYRWSSFRPQMVSDLSGVNPLLFFNKFLERYGSLAASDDGSQPVSALPILLWLAVALALAWLAHRLFRRRRAELAGVMNVGPVLTGISVFAVAFLAFSVPCMLPDYVAGSLPVVVLLLLSCAAAALIGLLVLLLLRAVGHHRWKGLLALPAGLAVMLAVVGVLGAGGLGYSAYVPKAEDVASVAVVYPGNPSYQPHQGYQESSGWIRYMETENAPIVMTDQADVTAVIEAHRRITEDGRPGSEQSLADHKTFCAVRLDYKLKNGAAVSRYYPYLKAATVAALLKLDTTAAARAAFEEYLTAQPTDGFNESAYQAGGIKLSSAFLAETRPITLGQEQRARLLESLEQDVASLDAAERYFSAGPVLCVLHFYEADGYGNTSESAIPQFTVDIHVTDRYARTIAFLQENGMGWALEARSDVERIEVLDYQTVVGRMTARNYSYTPLFQGMATTGEQFTYYMEQFGAGARSIDNADQVAQVLSRSHLLYFTDADGYLILIHYRGSDLVVSAFLPAKDAPDYVKQGVK